MRKDINVFIKEIKEVYGDKYDCSLIEYVNTMTKVKLICKYHGIFQQYPTHLLYGCGCQKCSNMARISHDEFVIQANKIHDNKYLYGEYKNKRTKMKIICPIHGEFYQLPKHHLNGVGCKECNESRGERKIKQLLRNLNINFEMEKRFQDCRYKKPLPFDFYIENKNICIEYDGIQHSNIIERFGGIEGYNELKIRDEIKTNFCLKNDIKLIRINYKDNIEEKLECLKMMLN